MTRQYAELRDRVYRFYGGVDAGRRPSIVTQTDALVVYSLVRGARPSLVVETGVSDGMSSWMILQALGMNGHGSLLSIDFPLVGLPRLYGQRPGWLVPSELADRWQLHLGRSQKVLPELLRTHPSIDMFLHDSEHSMVNMSWEFRAALEHLAPRGLLVADDALVNDAFLDIATVPLGNLQWAITTEGMGILRTGSDWEAPGSSVFKAVDRSGQNLGP